MFRVYVGCFGSGLGHASRMLEVADAARMEGGEVRFSSSGEVAEMIKGRGYPCNELPLADVLYSDDGSFSLRGTMESSPRILARVYKQVYREAANIARFRPAVVLSDSSLSTVIAAKLCEVPVLTVLNQLSLTSSQSGRGFGVKLLAFGTSTFIGRLWELSDEVLLPDLPPPYTISERNIWGSEVSKTRYIGFLQMAPRSEIDPTAHRLAGDPRRKVFWQVSGPPRTRLPFLRKALEVAEALSDEFVFVVSSGDPAGSVVPKAIPGGWCYGWCRYPERLFSACDVVVSRAGHGTIGQSIIASKPSLLVPIPNQPEQEGNAQKAQRLGVALCVEQEDLSIERVCGAMQRLTESEARDRVRRLGEYARGFDGVGEVMSAVRSLVT
jgi:UDP:flavonoid glycosyltransferase YjiC (YdhE family)